ncbi:hypothetical protein ACK4CS_16805 [Enterococcus gallinarum]|uniref:Uncharacterized protein n=1 Tax=Enterococcus gallinarum TaxID=1353 RepID=A0A376GVE0_ENTGA|nr:MULTISPECIES: hypothetical protein [Enterococcus]HAP5746491.1 hypothetical protein [Enterococcus faecalis]MDT2688217.1 hypothetical protein [Enterococcus gallinarum]MDT2691168.1 hypothetical protein [Enterococcus gallinarum]OJG40963.1 hypothetical protein RV03_GL003330 [Enterococcus gallinarum]CAI3304033.1 hypothetical protein CIRMBP1246_00740 [Enterococcus cecorum]
MSIGIIIDEPKNEKEQLFFIPVATEEVFSSYWLKASNELQLSWIPIFETGILIEKEDIPAILRELGLVKEWIKKNVIDIDTKIDLEKRINYILETLPKAFENKNIKLYIG